MATERFCVSCGKERRGGARFCFNCGATFDVAAQAAPTLQPVAPSQPMAVTMPDSTAPATAVTQPESTAPPMPVPQPDSPVQPMPATQPGPAAQPLGSGASYVPAQPLAPSGTSILPAVGQTSPSRPADVTSAGKSLIVLGGLTALAAVGLLLAYATGALQDRYDVADWFPVAAVIGGLVGGTAIAAGFGVLRLDPIWRMVGMIVGIVGVVGMLINVFSGVWLSLLLMFAWGRVVFRLSSSAGAFRR